MNILLRKLLTYWETGRVPAYCAVCGKRMGFLPQHSTPFTKVKVYHWKCIKPD